MTRDALKSLLQSSYKRERWLTLLHTVLPTTQVFGAAKDLTFDDASIASASQIARIPLAGDRTVAVLEVRVTGQVDLQRNRVGLRNLVSRLIGQEGADAVLAFFVGDAPDYRFSFAARTNSFTADGQLEQNETAPRRYTYLFGPGLPCRTALERLELLRSLGPRAQLTDLIEAFKVEPLFKEFYRDYGRVFDSVENHIRPTLPEKEPLRLFTQRLFNRLMFLAFVERKGWLKFGQHSGYLAALWNDHIARRRTSGAAGNFYADRLVPLFFEGLNQAHRPVGVSDPRFGNVPYLNGGLFEYADDGTDRLPALRVPDEAVALILDSETGLFSRYNFTVAESTPLEIQVAVDPEMLGKVFEELVTGRHEHGSYYTPKPIVAFMGRAALVEHVVDRCRSESRTAVERFVHDDDASALRDPEAVHRALLTVKVCDPACGSGAYLLGMLHELLDLRTRIFVSRQKADPETAYQRRLQIIERNLYGVDKDAFAVNIARLRLWLALAVEFEGPVPPPLPNLDFKIEVGDALAAPAPQDIFQRPAVEDFRDKKAAFLRAHGEEKAKLKTELERIRADLALWQQADLSDHGFNWAVEFAEVFLPDAEERALLGELLVQEDAPRTIQSGGFDIIVANPPYVRMELIKAQKPILRKRFRLVHAERADLYIYFYARAHELLRPGGVAAFISSNKWLRAGYGELLRQHLLDAQAFRLVMDFGELGVFDTAATDAAIFLWQKQPRAGSATAWAMVKDLPLCYRDGVRTHFQKLRVEVPADQFGEGKPRLATSAAADLRERMERSGPRIGTLYRGKLGYGIKTGLNDAFVIDKKTKDRLEQQSPASSSLIKPMVYGDDIRRYEVHYRGRYLIYTYHGVDMTDCESVLEHLSKYRELPPRNGKPRGLEHRATNQKWWELQQPQRAYEALFSAPKILYPDIGKENRFYLDEQGLYPETTGFVVGAADWFLLAVLNSKVAWTFFGEVCQALGDKDEGGRLRLKLQYVEQLPVPEVSNDDRSKIAELARRAQTLHGQRRDYSEKFIRALGIDPAGSNSRSPLEQPWTLAADDYAKRVRKLHGRAPDMKLYEAARDGTAALTGWIAKIEAEIDARVATLYGLDAEDQRWAAQSAPADDKQTLFFTVLSQLRDGPAYFPNIAIQAAANDAELALTDGSFKAYLGEAVAKGLLHDAGRGWYSRLSEPVALDPKPVNKLIRIVEKAFPLLDFSAWSTVQLNPWMHHILARPIAFLYAPADSLESIGDHLRSEGWEVAVNPTDSAAPKTVRAGEKMVVLRPSLGRQPAPTRHQAPIEQILVDLIVETGPLGLMEHSEAGAVVEQVVTKHLVQVAGMLRYADSRRVSFATIGAINQRHYDRSGDNS